MFRLLRFFSISSFIAFVVVTILLAILYRQSAINDLLTQGESKNVALTQVFSNTLWPEFADFVQIAGGMSADDIRVHPETAALREKVLEQMQGLTVVKVKVYNLDGLTVFSTQDSQIGEDKSNNAGFLSARDGVVANELSHRDSFSAFEGTITDRDLISSYVPVRIGGADQPIEGVFEVYDDVTPLLAQINQTQRNIILGVIGILGALYVGLFLIVRYADRIIQQQEQDRNEAEIAQRTSEVRLRTVLKSAPVILWAADAEGKVTVLEGRNFNLLGIEEERAIGRSITEVYQNTPMIIEGMKQALANKEFSALVQIKDYTFDTRYIPIHDAEGKVSGAVGVATNITERMIAEEALGLTEANLENQNMRLKRAHDFIRATLEQFSLNLQRGAPRTELLSYVRQAETEFGDLR